MGHSKDINNNDNNIYLYFINKYKRENQNSFNEYMKKMREMKKDVNYDSLTKEEQDRLALEI